MHPSVLLLPTLAGLVYAQVVPLTPPTSKVGSTVTLQWTPTTNTSWTSMNIDFMSGDNWNMIDLETIATGLDGTTLSSFTWTVPDVSIYSDIYFMQYTAGGAVSTAQWTTRFIIESAAGATVSPPDSIQPDGQTIGWGSGQLIGVAKATSSGSQLGSSSASSSSASSSSVPSSSSSSLGSSTSASSSSSSGSTSSSSASSSGTPSISQSSGANKQQSVQVAGVGLAVVLMMSVLMAL